MNRRNWCVTTLTSGINRQTNLKLAAHEQIDLALLSASCAVVFLFSAALDRCIIRLVEASGKATKITDGKKISKWTINQKKDRRSYVRSNRKGKRDDQGISEKSKRSADHSDYVAGRLRRSHLGHGSG